MLVNQMRERLSSGSKYGGEGERGEKGNTVKENKWRLTLIVFLDKSSGWFKLISNHKFLFIILI